MYWTRCAHSDSMSMYGLLTQSHSQHNTACKRQLTQAWRPCCTCVFDKRHIHTLQRKQLKSPKYINGHQLHEPGLIAEHSAHIYVGALYKYRFEREGVSDKLLIGHSVFFLVVFQILYCYKNSCIRHSHFVICTWSQHTHLQKFHCCRLVFRRHDRHHLAWEMTLS